MRIFVTGATGHVGFRVAHAFRRAGHHVLGLTRSEAGATRLDRHEIRPVLGTLQDPGSWKGAEEASVLVHVASDSKADTWAADRAAIDEAVTVLRRHRAVHLGMPTTATTRTETP